jgi:hypothetical protein
MHSRVAQFVRSRDLVFALLPVGPFFSAAITRQIGPSLQSRPFCMARAQNIYDGRETLGGLSFWTGGIIEQQH